MSAVTITMQLTLPFLFVAGSVAALLLLRDEPAVEGFADAGDCRRANAALLKLAEGLKEVYADGGGVQEPHPGAYQQPQQAYQPQQGAGGAYQPVGGAYQQQGAAWQGLDAMPFGGV